MAQTCARCGTGNPDGNAFCQQCGAPLAATPPAPGATPPAPGATPPAPAATPPVPGATPPATPSTPATPLTPPVPAATPPAVPAAAGAGAPRTVPAAAGGGTPGGPPAPPPLPSTPPPARAGRLSRNAIIAIAVVAVLLIAGAVVAFAFIHKGGSTPTPPPPTPVPTAAPTARPTAAPTATAQPSANPSPTANPSPGTNGGSGVLGSIFVPRDFQDNGPQTASNCPQQVDALTGPTPGSNFENIIYGGCVSLPAGATNAAFDDSLLQWLRATTDPNAAYCPDNGQPGPAKPEFYLNGDGGALPSDAFAICFTYTPQNGPAQQNEGFFLAAVGTRSDGSTAGAFIEFANAQGQGNDQWIPALLPNVISQTKFTDIAPPH